MNRRGKERKNVQMESTPSAPPSDKGEKAEPITAEHKGQTDRRGMCKKIQGVRGSVKAAVSTGVIKTNSLKLCEEKKTHSHSFNLPPASRSVSPLNEQEERRVVYVGRLRSDCTRNELKRRFEVFGEIEECAVNLRDDG